MGLKDVASLLDCLPSMHAQSAEFDPQHSVKLGVVAHALILALKR